MNKNKSPLRYPGGKTRAISLLMNAINDHYPNRKNVLSPFVGGGSFELFLQSNGYNVYANDLFTPLFTFWKQVQDCPSKLANLIRSMMPVSKESFYNYRKEIQDTNDFLYIAALFFIINRCSFSGSTFCGGFSQESANSRLTESSVVRLENVNMQNIHLHNLDYKEFLMKYPETENTIVYADPPYYIDSYIYGKNGDLHESFNHEEFATCIQQRKDWIVCYNDCEYIRNLYRNNRIEEVKWSYGMNKTKKSSEIFIFP
jgi:DNA adenine methylase